MVIIGLVIDGLMAASASSRLSRLSIHTGSSLAMAVIEPPFTAGGLTPQCVLHLEVNNYSIYGWIIIIIVDTGECSQGMAYCC